jgi:uncharacterized protein (TIGR02145 family)
MEPTIYKPGAHKTPGIYKGAGDIYKGAGVYKGGAGGGGGKLIIGGREYNVVNIGSQIWLSENLDYKFNGCNIGGGGNPTTPNAWYYNNDEANFGIDGVYKCGLLYNWYAAKYLDDNKDSLLPSGWRVPTDDDFIALTSFIGGFTTSSPLLKSIDNSIIPGFPSGWNGTDDYQFNMLPTGIYFNGFSGLNSETQLCSTTESRTYIKRIRFDSSNQIGYGNGLKGVAGPIRLVKDA